MWLLCCVLGHYNLITWAGVCCGVLALALEIRDYLIAELDELGPWFGFGHSIRDIVFRFVPHKKEGFVAALTIVPKEVVMHSDVSGIFRGGVVVC